MLLGIPIIAHKSPLERKDGVVPAHAAILAGEPMRAALPENYVSRNDKFGIGLFGPEAFAGPRGGFVGTALGGMRGWPCVTGVVRRS